MRPNDLPRFLTVLVGVADYYGKTLSESVQDVYWNGLQEYDLMAVEKAMWEHAKSPDAGQFMPKIADVVRMLQGSTTDQSLVAWAKVDRAVRGVGCYMDVAFDDPLIHRVLLEMGGWSRMGMKTEDEWPFVGKEFQNRYRGYRMRNETPDYPPVLTGTANSYNASNGYALQAPVLVGDQTKARQVLLGGTNKPLIPMQQAAETIKRLQ